MKRSICVVTSVIVAAAMGPIGLSVAQADNGNHYGWDKQKPKHSQNAQLQRNDDKENDKRGKHADGENQNQRHNQNAQLNRNDHDGKDNNGKHVGWDKHIGKPTSDWTNHHPTASVPEPASLVLLGAGVAGIGILRRMSRKA